MSISTTLALTTTFSPAPECTTDTWYIEFVSNTYYYTTSFADSNEGWYLSQGPSDWSSCFPSGYKPTTAFYYSPGICPLGYTAAKSSIVSLGTMAETRATCCPSGFTAQSRNDLAWFSTAGCFSDNQDPDHVWTFSQGGSITSRTTGGGLNAKGVFIRYQSTDFQTPATTSATTTTGSSATTTGSTTRTTALSLPPSATAASGATNTNATSDSSQGSSSKAWIAGPVIGVVVACALIAFAATWYNRRRYHQKAAKGVELPAERPHRMAELSHEPVVHEAPSMEQNMYRPPVELPATKR